MTYVMSDIHGEYSLFLELLSKINFSDNDILYICGDIIEKGPDSIRLAKYIFSHNNIKVIRGNHEEDFLKYFHSLMRDREGDYDEVLERLREYIGGDDAHLLDWDVVDSIEKLPYYIETEDFICVHAGVPLDENKNIPDLKTVPIEELVYNRTFKIPEVAPFDSRCVFYGHTSSMSVFGDARIVEFHRGIDPPKSIKDIIKVHLDTGVFTSGVLACFCVETCASEFVRKRKLLEANNKLPESKHQNGEVNLNG